MKFNKFDKAALRTHTTKSESTEASMAEHAMHKLGQVPTKAQSLWNIMVASHRQAQQQLKDNGGIL